MRSTDLPRVAQSLPADYLRASILVSRSLGVAGVAREKSITTRLPQSPLFRPSVECSYNIAAISLLFVIFFCLSGVGIAGVVRYLVSPVWYLPLTVCAAISLGKCGESFKSRRLLKSKAYIETCGPTSIPFTTLSMAHACLTGIVVEAFCDIEVEDCRCDCTIEGVMELPREPRPTNHISCYRRGELTNPIRKALVSPPDSVR